MKLTVGQLRSLIFEAVYSSPSSRAAEVARHVVDITDDYVDSIVAGKPDKQSESELRNLAQQSLELANWLAKRKDPTAPKMMQFARAAMALTNNSGFWKRPTFLNTSDYVEKMQSLQRGLHHAAVGVMSN